MPRAPGASNGANHLGMCGPATAGLADLTEFVGSAKAMGLPAPDFVSSVALHHTARGCPVQQRLAYCCALPLQHLHSSGSLTFAPFRPAHAAPLLAYCCTLPLQHHYPSDGKSGPTPMQQACPDKDQWDPNCCEPPHPPLPFLGFWGDPVRSPVVGHAEPKR